MGGPDRRPASDCVPARRGTSFAPTLGYAQKATRASVFVAFTPSIDRIFETTTFPIASYESASTFAIRSYSPKSGYSSTMSLIFVSFW